MKILLGIFIATFLMANEYGKIDMHGGKSDTLYKNNFNNNSLSSMFKKKTLKERSSKEKKELEDLKKLKNSEKINDK